MANSNEMTDTIAVATGVARPKVAWVVRVLREANLLTSGGRGKNAPRMKPIDTARVLIALLASDRPSDAVKLVKEFGQFWLAADYLKPQPDYLFEEALADLIEAIAALPPNYPLSIHVNVQLDFKHMKCTINNGKQSHDYVHKSLLEFWRGTRADAEPNRLLKTSYAQSRILIIREIESETLAEVATDHRID